MRRDHAQADAYQSALIVGLVFLSSAASGQQLTGKEIIKNTDALLWGKTSVGIFELRVEWRENRWPKYRLWSRKRRSIFSSCSPTRKDTGNTSCSVRATTNWCGDAVFHPSRKEGAGTGGILMRRSMF
jgi:hypothetical protein